MNASAHQRSEVGDPLWLQAVVSYLMWVLGTKLRFSGRAICALNH